VRKRRDNKVFAAYRSFDVPEIRKPPSKLLWYSIGGIGVTALLFYALMNSFGSPVAARTDPDPHANVGNVPVRLPVVMNKTVPSKIDAPPDEVGYVGVIGGKLLVQCRGQIRDYGECIQGRYGVVEAGTSFAKVITDKGNQYVYRLKNADRGIVPSDNPPGRKE